MPDGFSVQSRSLSNVVEPTLTRSVILRTFVLTLLRSSFVISPRTA